MSSMTARGTGRTTRQMVAAEHGAIYIWPHQASLSYPRDLARYLGRNDLKIEAAHTLRVNRGIQGVPVVVDHACTLDDEQRFVLDYIKRRRDG